MLYRGTKTKFQQSLDENIYFIAIYMTPLYKQCKLHMMHPLDFNSVGGLGC